MKIITILLFLLNFNCLLSQTYNSIKELNSTNGLPSDIVYNTVQDKKGYIWIATENGIVKYNGTSFKIFQKKDGLPNNDIFKLNVDSKNRIWITGFHKGLYYIENDSVKSIKNSKNINGLSFTFEKNNHIHFKIFYLNDSFVLNSKMELKKFFFKNENNDLIDFVFKTNQYIGFDRLEKRYFSLHKSTKKLLPKNYIYCKNLYYNTPAFVEDRTLKKPYSIEREIDNKVILLNGNDILHKDFSKNKTHFLNIDSDDTYTILKDQTGVFVYKKGVFNLSLSSKLKKLTKLIHNIKYIVIDNQENFWFIYRDSKLVFIPRNFDLITNYNKEEILKEGTSIKHSLFDNENFYFITSSNNFYKIDLTEKYLTEIKKYKNKTPLKILKNKNKIVVACTEGLDYFDEKTLKNNFLPIINRATVFNNEDFYQVDMTRIKKNGKIIYERPNTLRFNTLFYTNENNILVSNEEEVFRFNELKKTIIHNTAIKSTNVINQLKHHILFGTNYEGLILTDSNLKIHDKVLMNENISCIETDSNTEEIFVASNKGFYLFKIKNNLLKLINSYSVKNGLIGGKIVALKSTPTKVFITSLNGFSVLNREMITGDKIWGKIDFNGFLINGDESEKPIKPNVFERTQNDLALKTSIFSLQSESNFNTHYLISRNGEPSDWNNFNEKNLQFRGLQYGNYTVKLKLTSANNNITYDEKTIQFKIKPYVWETLLFKILIIGIFVLTLLTFYFYYKRKTNRKYNLKLKLYTLELKALKAQMSPHFIFNSLNNFQSLYILEGEMSANHFLTKFSSFIRKTLDIVNKDNISIYDEIEYLKSFIEIEALKNNLDIKFNFKADDSLQLNNLSIPVMLLQPIIENSLLHGLLPHIDDKTINIEIKRTNNEFIEIRVEDNGVGLHYNKNVKKKNHVSLATKIINDRIAILNALTKVEKYNLSIEEITENQNVMGTRVVLKIPFNLL
ncbi:histidine kinase [Flavobacterium sp.]|uniref:sensor histidine kinase n=1 Tax=Flavobacterium sp. TaxID=239 RepID=UPI0025C2FEA6|nr:histidine kinase [Flavobacterium sp.]